MVARRGAVALAAIVGVSLQGCMEQIHKTISGFVEQSCAAAIDGAIAEAEKKGMDELSKECNALSENKTFVDLLTELETIEQVETKCLDDGAQTISTDIEAARKNMTDTCVQNLKDATSGRDLKNIGEAAQKLIDSWTGDLSNSLHKHLNETVSHIHDHANNAVDAVKDGANAVVDDAKDKLDEVKDGVNQHVDDAKDTLKDQIDSVSDSLGGGDEEPARLFSMVRLPGTNAGSSTVACVSGAALFAVAGLVVVVRRASRPAVAEQCAPILACDEEL